MKLFLDTCTLLDYYARRAPFFEDMQKVRIAQFFGDVSLYASVQSLCDIEYILSKAIGKEQIRKMMYSSLSFLHVVPASASNVEQMLTAGWKDLEDCVIAHTAAEYQMDYLLTRNLKDFESSQVVVLSPSGWLSMMEENGVTYEDANLS